MLLLFYLNCVYYVNVKHTCVCVYRLPNPAIRRHLFVQRYECTNIEPSQYSRHRRRHIMYGLIKYYQEIIFTDVHSTFKKITQKIIQKILGKQFFFCVLCFVILKNIKRTLFYVNTIQVYTVILHRHILYIIYMCLYSIYYTIACALLVCPQPTIIRIGYTGYRYAVNNRFFFYLDFFVISIAEFTLTV